MHKEPRWAMTTIRINGRANDTKRKHDQNVHSSIRIVSVLSTSKLEVWFPYFQILKKNAWIN